ncbi:LytTR family transcriptional regulator DNA-binding domain-containing protein [Dyadobacter sp. CY347]|nr:LytTR family transcriptional regulator DNA-binding domain-containing protein [Dyadobacter sp. CY347]MCF2491507.1 LytTR family transcriptional regulator DNA-binding domain-containing protein [Dyadobacter sp. CY347]
MPEMNGFEFIRSLQIPRPHSIIISADASYAIEGFVRQVADHLLKPVAFEKFMRSVTKVFAENASAKEVLAGIIQENPLTISTVLREFDNVVDSTAEFLILKEDKKLIRVENGVNRCYRGYERLFKGNLAGRSIVTHMTMADGEKTLPSKLFFRVHRSFIVNKKVIREILGNEITITATKKIPTGKTSKPAVLGVFPTNKA